MDAARVPDFFYKIVGKVGSKTSIIEKMHPTLHNFEDSDTLRTAPLYSYPVVSRIKKKDSKTTMTPSYGNQNAGKFHN